MTDDLEQARLDADKRYNDALTALDRVIVNATRLADLSRDDAASIGTALLVFLQQITAFVDTKNRALTAQLASRLDEHQRLRLQVDQPANVQVLRAERRKDPRAGIQDQGVLAGQRRLAERPLRGVDVDRQRGVAVLRQQR